jgi:hypothetical protein
MMEFSNMETGTISKETMEDFIKQAKERRGKKIEGPIRHDNSFGAVFTAIEEYKREHDEE